VGWFPTISRNLPREIVRPTRKGRTMEHPNIAHDRQWALTIEIAAKLWIEGEYVTEVDLVPTQRYVDLRWAAHQAGRVLGGRSRIRTSKRQRHPLDPIVVMTVTYVDPTGHGFQQAEEGLETLMRLVLEEQGTHCH
jgi:hypothetical protein